MTNSYASLLQDLYADVLVDIRRAYPALHKDLERDYSRLLSSLESRGCSFFTIELPEIGKHFDKCLAHGSLTSSGLTHQSPFRKGATVPRLFKGLLLRVFKASGELLDSPDVQAIRFLRQLYYGAKKVRMECTDDRTWKQARSFFRVESSLRSPTLNWAGDDLDGEARLVHFGQGLDNPRDPQPDLFDLEEGEARPASGLVNVFQDVCDILASELGWFDPSSYLPKHGPGAVAGLKKGDSKFEFPHWPAKLESVFPMADFAFANYGLWADAVHRGELSGRFSSHEPPSVLIAVPKTQKGPRLIAKEPVAHQWCQQSILRYFAERTAKTTLGLFVDFRSQQRNRAMALESSRNGLLMTVDLSAASDRVTCWTVERAFRRNKPLLRALHASRTRWCENTIDPTLPRYHLLRKFASMGSACTFPVETFVFTAAAIASVLSTRALQTTVENVRSLRGQVRVFGDDIVIPVDAGPRFSGLLGYLQLEINTSKTFGTGKFRESCGVDAYDGHDVTPTYVMTYPSRDRPESVASAVATHNNFYENCYFAVAARIRRTLLKFGYAIPEVWAGSGLFGLWTNQKPDNSHLRMRVNPDTHVVEYRAHLPYGKVTKVADRGDSSLLRYFIEDPDPMSKWESGYVTKSSTLMRRGWRAALA
ncbi:MAG: putative replicase protein [Alehxovirus frumenticola]|uniref:RNA-directed RNA polymerase n=1 Tax=Leviviridae sp. TaxID=2027243 RepID=A0ABY3SS31_9VIRU|nr:MAG: putative replicase protein [Leviviridae sp.]